MIECHKRPDIWWPQNYGPSEQLLNQTNFAQDTICNFIFRFSMTSSVIFQQLSSLVRWGTSSAKCNKCTAKYLVDIRCCTFQAPFEHLSRVPILDNSCRSHACQYCLCALRINASCVPCYTGLQACFAKVHYLNANQYRGPITNDRDNLVGWLIRLAWTEWNRLRLPTA